MVRLISFKIKPDRFLELIVYSLIDSGWWFVVIVVTQVKSPTLITKVNPSIKLKSFQTDAYFSLLSDKDIEALYNIYRYVLCIVNTEHFLR